MNNEFCSLRNVRKAELHHQRSLFSGTKIGQSPVTACPAEGAELLRLTDMDTPANTSVSSIPPSINTA